MRDRLIELVWEVPFMCEGNEPFMRGVAGEIADHLLANSVIVPTCNVGDTVYAITRWNGEWVIREVEVCNYTIFDNEWKIVDPYGDYWSVNNFGKTVFLTREEAEKALAEREGK
jgi:saccharopine dehydrogenase-like NADP-dependent oxidoreductase